MHLRMRTSLYREVDRLQQQKNHSVSQEQVSEATVDARSSKVDRWRYVTTGYDVGGDYKSRL